MRYLNVRLKIAKPYLEISEIYKMSQSEFCCPEANIDIAHHVKSLKINYFHPDFFSRPVETFLARFILAESGLIDQARKYIKRYTFFPSSQDILPQLKSSLMCQVGFN